MLARFRRTRYRLEAPLGVGPDGVVHRAVAERLGARPVAVRRLPVPVGKPRATLRRDAETVASLGHPGLAVVDDIVDVDDETVLVASTLGTRGTLADRLALGPLDIDEAVALVRTVAAAMDAAHGRGLTHGRLTATNVLLTDEGPVVCDLVQAAALRRSATQEHSATCDTTQLIHLAASLVDGTDRSPRATTYRSLCRWSAESGAGLQGFVAALGRLDPAVESPTRLPTTTATPPSASPADNASVGLVVSISLAVGALVGGLATRLPPIG